jgi:hypothetical protein
MAYNPANPFAILMSGAERTFNHLPNQQYAAFNYAYNPYADNGNGVTGQHQLLTTNDQGALRVDIGTGIQISATVDDIAITGGQINVIGFSTLTGQVAQLQVSVDAIADTVTTKWQKVKTTGYVDTFNASATPKLVNKVQGYTKTITQPSFIQLFDSATTPTAGAVPDFVITVQTTNNWFLNLAEEGVEFTAGLQIVNSSTPDVYTALGAPDFIASAVLK